MIIFFTFNTSTWHSYSLACIIVCKSLPSRIVCSSILYLLLPCTWAHTWQCALFTGMLARSFWCADIFNPLHSGLTNSTIFTNLIFLCIKDCADFLQGDRQWLSNWSSAAQNKMASKTLKFVLCYSSLCIKLQNGFHAEDWCACIQAIVSHRANIYQTDLNSQHTGTGIPNSEPNSYISKELLTR